MSAFNVLGVCDGHNASAALACDGRIVAAVSEERFSRRKNHSGYPDRAVEFCLEDGGVEPCGLTLVVLVGRVIHPLWAALRREECFSIDDYVREQRLYWSNLPPSGDAHLAHVLEGYVRTVADNDHRHDLEPYLNRWSGVSLVQAFESYAVERRLRLATHLGIDPQKVLLADHHRCHALYGYYSAPFRGLGTLVLTLDASGDGVNATASIGQTDCLKEIFRTDSCDLARLYRAVTLLLGLKPEEHEYKVMGLAPYAPVTEKERAARRIRRLLQECDGLSFRYPDGDVPFERLFLELTSLAVGVRFDGLAAAVQGHVENLLTRWIDSIHRVTECRQLVLSGGLALNCKANGVIARRPWVERIFVPPGPGDESTAVGAAYLGMAQICHALGIPTSFLQPLEHAYLGPGIAPVSAEAVAQRLAGEGFRVGTVSEKQVASDLAAGKIIGRCAGRMEFGPRALGNRSILCDPSNLTASSELNRRVKKRDFWMPFAPVVLDSDTQTYFDDTTSIDCRFMTVCVPATVLCQQEAPAAIHPHDRSARPQVLDSQANPAFAGILKAFRGQTGRGVLLNTSMNVHGSPICCSEKDALELFRRTTVDCLILENCYISR